jgi:hypothetical protein
MSKAKKALLGLVGLPFLGFVALILVWYTHLSVGYLNLTVSLWELHEQADLAMGYPVEPGQTVLVQLEDGQLVEQVRGRMSITRKAGGERFVLFDRGGGHLGNQGYVYAPYAEDTRQVHNDVFGGYEGRELWYLYGSWWSYDSPED